MNRRIVALTLGVVVVFLMAACAPAASPTAAPPEPVTTDAPPAPSVVTESPPAVPTETPEDVPVEPTEAPMVIVTPRTEMEATNPGSVNLASGTPTLVEFFAFW